MDKPGAPPDPTPRHASEHGPASDALLTVVCIATGDWHGRASAYLARLDAMLRRHCPRPFRLVCYTDRPRRGPDSVQWRDCAGWHELAREGMHPTLRKLGLFNAAYVEFDEFLYLDLSIVIRRRLGDLLHFAAQRTEPLVMVKEWHYAGYNSCAMRIRRGALQCIYDDFVAGIAVPQRVPGDQDVVHGLIARRGLQHRVAHFESAHVVSFKQMLRLSRREPAAARARLAEATVVKFHGEPKMHQAFGWRFRWRVRWHELCHGRWTAVMPMAELRAHWVGSPTT